MQKLSKRIPVIVAHGLQCDTSYAAMLMKALPSDWPIMGLAGVGLRGDRPPLTSIEDMARHFVSKMQERYGAQPCILAGFCAGGHISIEMANQIRTSGGSVERIYLLDTPRLMPSEYYQKLTIEQIEIARSRLITHPELVRYFAGGPATVSAFVKALEKYVHTRVEWPTTVLATTEMLPLITDAKLGWPNYLQDNTDYIAISPDRNAFVSSGIRLVADYIIKRHPQS